MKFLIVIILAILIVGCMPGHRLVFGNPDATTGASTVEHGDDEHGDDEHGDDEHGDEPDTNTATTDTATNTATTDTPNATTITIEATDIKPKIEKNDELPIFPLYILIIIGVLILIALIIVAMVQHIRNKNKDPGTLK